MEREDLFRKLSQPGTQKMVLVVLDGLGGLPIHGRTELETASTPNLDLLAAESELGLTHPIAVGITPGSGPAHLALFGYDPLKYEIGRGILEALGSGVEVTARDVAVRGNFATQQDGIITDRRAGRLPTEANRKVVAFLSERISRIEDVEVSLTSGEEHRFVLRLRGDGLDDALTDADPEATGLPIRHTQAKRPAAEKTARIVNRFLDEMTAALAGQLPANTCLLRGFSKYPQIPSMNELFGLKTAAIAVYPMYRGLAQLVGMEVLPTGRTLDDQCRTLKENFDRYDFFFVHVKKTDSYGEDGNFDAKVHMIEEFDHWLPAILELRPDVLAITGDHSTPAAMKSHSWHPNPFLIKATHQRIAPLPPARLDAVGHDDGCAAAIASAQAFGEGACATGVLGRFASMDILPLMMANAGRFKKYGA
ncbi:MAG TPA: 2,3-bisphosphoglycerate-independent phosphoglycerate mutase [Candidatus Aminicenantes bacterium]|nr:2,3-bisphosphoglycerate-independent phosphoglycerate mutase [Candidatus Aminicenantes bacterium]